MRDFLRQAKGQLEAEDHYNRKAQAFVLGSAEDARAGFYFVSYAWEPPSGLDARRGWENPLKPEVFADCFDLACRCHCRRDSFPSIDRAAAGEA